MSKPAAVEKGYGYIAFWKRNEEGKNGPILAALRLPIHANLQPVLDMLIKIYGEPIIPHDSDDDYAKDFKRGDPNNFIAGQILPPESPWIWTGPPKI